MSAILELLNIKSSGSLTCRSYQNLTFFCPFHLHPEYELVFIDRGHIEAFVGNQQHFLTQSELQLVASNIPHSFKLEGENQTAFLSKYMQSLWYGQGPLSGHCAASSVSSNIRRAKGVEAISLQPKE